MTEVVGRLAERFTLAAVSSSALSRLNVCFTATGLADLIAPGRRFSAEDSLDQPTSKPDPAAYVLAGERLGVSGEDPVAVEDSATGVQSARAAGFPVLGLLHWVAPDECEARRRSPRGPGHLG